MKGCEKKNMKKEIINFICSKKMKHILLFTYFIASLTVLTSSIYSYKIKCTSTVQAIGVASMIIWVAMMILIWNYHDIRNALLEKEIEQTKTEFLKKVDVSVGPTSEMKSYSAIIDSRREINVK